MKKAILSLLPLTYLMSVNAQELAQQSFFANEASRELTVSAVSKLKNTFTGYNVYSLDIGAMDNAIKKDGSPFTLDIDFGGTYSWQLHLAQYDILSENYTRVESGSAGEVTYTERPAITYKGYNGNTPGDLVYLTILPDYISGFIQKDGEFYFIEPVKGLDKSVRDELFVIYNSKELRSGVSCGVNTAQDPSNWIKQAPVIQPVSSGQMACAKFEIAIAATYDFITKYGGAASAETKVISQLNIANGLFAQTAIDIQFSMIKFYAATASNQIIPDSQKDIITVLGNFKTWGQGGGFGSTVYDVATLWVGRDMTCTCGTINGYAYGGSGPSSQVMCSANRYNTIDDVNATNVNGVLHAHEIGHNFGAAHQTTTNAIMNSYVTPASNIWTSTCVSTITGTKNGATCKSTCTTTGIKEILAQDKFLAFPNPFSNTTSLRIDRDQSREGEWKIIQVYDVLGKEVKSFRVTSNDVILTRDGLEDGIYFYRVLAKDKVIASEKISILSE